MGYWGFEEETHGIKRAEEKWRNGGKEGGKQKVGRLVLQSFWVQRGERVEERRGRRRKEERNSSEVEGERERESREMIEEGGGERAAGEEERERARFSLGKIIPHLLRKFGMGLIFDIL